MTLRPYVDGFQLTNAVCEAVSMPLAAVSVAKGDLLVDNGNGYLTNAGITAFVAANKYYVAIEPVDNSAGAVGDLNILCVSCDDSTKRYIVPNNSATVAAQTDIGEVVDLDSEDDIDVTDTTVAGMGFLIEEIDISAAAVAVKTGGFVKGRFVVEGDQA